MNVFLTPKDVCNKNKAFVFKENILGKKYSSYYSSY